MRKRHFALAVVWLGVLTLAHSCASRPSLLSCLPPTLVDGQWKLTGTPTLIHEPDQLRALLDGTGIPYYDGGWVESAHATYKRVGEAMDVTAYDMGTEDQARTVVTGGNADAGVLGTVGVYYSGVTGAYVGVALSGRYVFVAVGVRTPADDLAAFLLAIATRCG